MKTEQRPWVMEVWEVDPDTIEAGWVTWSTTREKDNALRIRDRLLLKGKRARVRNSLTDEVLGEKEGTVTCSHCGEHHPAPFDGSCLL